MLNKRPSIGILDSSQKKWNLILNEYFVNIDVYYLSQYCNLYTSADTQAKLFYYIKNDNIFVLPFMKCRVNNSEYYDIETPYGYGGPLVLQYDEAFITESWDVFIDIAKADNIVAAFLRFHPILDTAKNTSSDVKTIFNSQIVTLMLNKSYEQINAGYTKQNRKKIKKARKAIPNVLIDNSLNNVKIFFNLYHETMKRVSASSFYFFSYDYFVKMFKNMSDNIKFITCYIDEEPVGSALLFIKGNILTFHLSATNSKGRECAASNLMRDEAVKYALSHNINVINFGGGSTSAEDDSLLKFKSGFSNERADFYIGSIIFNDSVYQKLVLKWEQGSTEEVVKQYNNRILKYRY